ncbi:hypothetical protein [Streptomyces griseus]|uniref:VMAP-C domain-containing protein n=1 Tax=Streptomyces griseus TaxID=1911 RepID=UPI0004C84667|nr:hypothetical protein [Streptomyces griseus]
MTGGLPFDEGLGTHAPDLRRELVEQLCAVPGLEAPGSRSLLISMLAERLPEVRDVPQHGRTRLDILEIVRSCLREPHGLRELADTLSDYAPGATPVREIRRLADAAATAPPPLPDLLPVLPEAELREVRALLAPLRNLDALGLLHAAARELPLPARPVSGLDEVVDLLTRVNARPDGLLPVSVLVEHVIAELDGSEPHRPVVTALREWNDAQAAKLLLTRQLAAVRAEIAREAAARPAPACLVLQLCRSGMDPDRYTLSHWRQIRPGPWRPARGEDRLVTLAEVPAAVGELVGRTEEEWADGPGRPVLEFFLPFHLLDHPVEWFASGSGLTTPLCLTYPVVLRSLDRMRAPRHHRQWHNRWQRMLEAPDTVCHWDTTGQRDHDAVRWSSTLAAEERLTSVGFDVPPLRGEGERRAFLETALRVGVPLAVWDRRPVPSPDFRRRARKLLKGKAIELPQRAKGLRSEAATAAAGQRDVHPGRHLAVLFDDPDRLVDWSGPPGPGAGSARGGHDDEGET